MNDTFSFKPIGYFESAQEEKYMAAKQPGLSEINSGLIILNTGQNYEEALKDLEGFNKIWVIFCFHKNTTWKPKVMTPRGGAKKGVFATRSPHRPNAIGLSAVDLIKIDGRKLYIGKSDLISTTPILDIKPYLTYADSFPEASQGWLESTEPNKIFSVAWSDVAEAQRAWIEEKSALNLKETLLLRLKENPFPFPGHRIKKRGEGQYEIALKAWRIDYIVTDELVEILKVRSGYTESALKNQDKDILLHQAFISHFYVK